MQNGMDFQNTLSDTLRGLSWNTIYNESWDRYEAIDIYIDRHRNRRLIYPIELQVTRRYANPHKFDRWIKSRDPRAWRSQVYVDVLDLEAGEAAVPLDVALYALTRRGPDACGIFVLEIVDGGTCRWTEPQRYLQALWDTFDAEWESPERRIGFVSWTNEKGFSLVHDDASGRRKRYYCFLEDIVDVELLRLVRDGGLRNGVKISFMPTGRFAGGKHENARSLRLVDEDNPLVLPDEATG
jgi:hypothetical protein